MAAYKSGIFPPELRRPEHDIETVKIMARGLNKMIVSQLEKPDDDELAKRAWASTMEEIDMQWVWLDDTSEVGNFLLAKRFPLEQKQKLRIIDDCTAGGLNQTCGSQEKLKIHAIDELIAYLSWSIAHYGDPLVAKLVGKTFDLTSACIQTIWHLRGRQGTLAHSHVGPAPTTSEAPWCQRPAFWGNWFGGEFPSCWHGNLVCGVLLPQTGLDLLL